ncbi:MAG: methyltransferase domain-containing protein [Bacteroidota bacterium]
MNHNKPIERDGQSATHIFDNRSLAVDYRNLSSLLTKGMRILDVGCGTGAISKDIAQIVGPTGRVIGIDNTEKFIASGRQSYGAVNNLELLHQDFFAYHSDIQFDLIVSARVLQWLSNPVDALVKMREMLSPTGQVSILDYNHADLEWTPDPPKSMQEFYDIFLKWRADAGMHNRIAEELSGMMEEAGFHSIEVLNSDEYYDRSRKDFLFKVGIWSKVASSTQMVEEGYLDDELRLQAIEEYTAWVQSEAVSMTMKLNEVRGRK